MSDKNDNNQDWKLIHKSLDKPSARISAIQGDTRSVDKPNAKINTTKRK